MRAAVVSDTDGSTEFQRVKLEPQNWCAFGPFRFSSPRAKTNLRAWLAKKKAAAGPKGETVESLTYKISRLTKLNLILNGMITVWHVSRWCSRGVTYSLRRTQHWSPHRRKHQRTLASP